MKIKIINKKLLIIYSNQKNNKNNKDNYNIF